MGRSILAAAVVLGSAACGGAAVDPPTSTHAGPTTSSDTCHPGCHDRHRRDFGDGVSRQSCAAGRPVGPLRRGDPDDP